MQIELRGDAPYKEAIMSAEAGDDAKQCLATFTDAWGADDPMVGMMQDAAAANGGAIRVTLSPDTIEDAAQVMEETHYAGQAQTLRAMIREVEQYEGAQTGE